MIHQWFLFNILLIKWSMRGEWKKKQITILPMFIIINKSCTQTRLLNDLIYVYTNISAHMSYNWVIILKRILDIT